MTAKQTGKNQNVEGENKNNMFINPMRGRFNSPPPDDDLGIPIRYEQSSGTKKAQPWKLGSLGFTCDPGKKKGLQFNSSKALDIKSSDPQ